MTTSRIRTLVNPQRLEPFGTTPAEAEAILWRELGDFEALFSRLEKRWLEPLYPGAWSPAQIAEHVAITNRHKANTLRLLERGEPLADVFVVQGTFARGKPQSPDYALPSEGQPPTVIRDVWQQMHTDIASAVAQVSVWHGDTRQHPFFGELDALDWLRVMSFHTAHHRRGLEPTLST